MFVDAHLRELTQRCADEMHTVFRNRQLPRASKQRGCSNCSLVSVCMPEISSKVSVDNYLRKVLYEETA